jgi:hypothetical protein
MIGCTIPEHLHHPLAGKLAKITLSQLTSLPPLTLRARQTRLLIDLPGDFTDPQIARYLNLAFSVLRGTNHKIILRPGNIHGLAKLGDYLINQPHARMLHNNLVISNDANINFLEIMHLAELAPMLPNLFLWWVKTGKYIKADNKAWIKIKQSWRGARPIIICGMCPWHLVSWALPLAPQRLITADDVAYEYTPLRYLGLPNRTILLERLTPQDLTAKAAGIWHGDLLDDYLEYHSWADILFDVADPAKFMPFVKSRLEELATPIEA